MASKTTNSAIEALERRHVAERAALKAATEAGAAVRRAQQRRAAEVARLDEMVAQAERGADVALAVLASLMAPDIAAQLLEETPARVRLGQQRAPVEDVNARLSQLTDGVPVARRRGRPRGGGRSVREDVAAVASESGVANPFAGPALAGDTQASERRQGRR